VGRLRELEDASRFVDVSWIDGIKSSFLTQIQVEGLDRANMLADITRALSDNHVNIISGNIDTTKDRIAISRWTFEIADPQHLATVMGAIRKINGVFDVYRLTGRRNEKKE
jgi:GTP pyrophosphokinase